MRIDTWINDELITVDTDDVWLETFAHWDARVPTDVAVAIAAATVHCLITSQENNSNADRQDRSKR